MSSQVINVIVLYSTSPPDHATTLFLLE